MKGICLRFLNVSRDLLQEKRCRLKKNLDLKHLGPCKSKKIKKQPFSDVFQSR